MKTSINLEITFFSFHKNLVKIGLVLTIFLAGIAFFYHFWLHSQTLEEAINEQKVWQEVKDLQIPSEEIDKLIGEIIGIKSKIRKGDPCVQYVLEASISGFYPCFHSKNRKIFLKKGEIWKIGKTCLDDKERYSSGYPDERLLLIRQFEGTAEQCLIMEKIKLYAYVLSPENQNRAEPIKLPPGNKIHR